MKKTALFISSFLLGFSSFAQVDLDKGLMLYLPFEGNTRDHSPNANDAYNYGATLTTDQWGRSNRAYYFDGSGSYMRIPTHSTLHPDAALTLSARVKVAGFYNDVCQGNSIIKTGTDNAYGSYALRFSPTNGLGCSVQDTNNQNYYGFAYNMPTPHSVINKPPYVHTGGGWDCLIWSFDGTTVKMYVNGILRYTDVATGSSIGVINEDVYLGNNMGSSSHPYWFKGAMDEVRIYNRGLNTAEIDSLCKLKSGQTSAIGEQFLESLPLVLVNPVGNNLQLTLAADQLGGDLRILDMSGRMLLDISNLQDTRVDVTTLPAGTYIISYSTADKQTLRHSRMVKL